MTGTAEELIHHHATPLTIAGPAVRGGPSAVAVVGDEPVPAWCAGSWTASPSASRSGATRSTGRTVATPCTWIPEVRVILNAVSADDPSSFRRRSKDIFVVGVAELERRPEDMLQAGYSLLVRSLSNVFIPMVRDQDGTDAHFITMEQGFHRFPATATTTPSSRPWSSA